MQQQQGSPIYSIDVEAVATGTDHNSRAVAQISLIDQYEQVRSLNEEDLTPPLAFAAAFCALR
jgi:hypothetical protein